MFHGRPSGISTLGGSTGNSLAKLSALEGAARAMLVGIVPLIALQALGSQEAVSWMYLAAAVFTMAVTLNFSILERILQRRWILTLGGVFVICASFLFYFSEGWVVARWCRRQKNLPAAPLRLCHAISGKNACELPTSLRLRVHATG